MMADITPDMFFDIFKLLLRNLPKNDPLKNFSIHSGFGLIGEKKLLIFNIPNKITDKRIGISVVSFKTFSESDNMIELALLIENDSPSFFPFYPSEYGYNFDKPKLFKNIQDILDHLRSLSQEIKTPYLFLQFGDFDPEEI